ncbi:MAG TPA: adenosylcobinamide-phosphate synthase CbiB [Syntrophomonadaceae bacterium]|nr:adenosylcobinamide-phosphate synthase CbiB [Syntrophomonadaceae bacterium]
MEIIVLAGAALDLILGDPRWMPHPVCWIGRFIVAGECLVRRWVQGPAALKAAGILLTLMIVSSTYFFFWGLLHLAYRIHYILGLGLSVLIISQSLAMKSLYTHARAVAKPLKNGDLPAARHALAMIVGRDTDQLDEKEIVRATVETVAENTVDGITAPLFFSFLGGPPLAMAYKAVNTLDSMIGYKNEKYRDLGWGAARLDDIVNYLPARATALLYLILAPFTNGGMAGVWGAMRKYSSRHPSPNSGIPEAAVAGALQVQLGGSNYYGGILSDRALMGDDIRPLEQKYIADSLHIMLAVSLEAVLAGVILGRFL